METIQGPDVSRYTYRVTWSVEDGEFVATCAEFPSLSWLADSQAAALQGLVAVVADAVADLVSQARPSPNPCQSAATRASSTCVSAKACTAAWPSKPPKNTSVSTSTWSSGSLGRPKRRTVDHIRLASGISHRVHRCSRPWDTRATVKGASAPLPAPATVPDCGRN